MFEPNSIKSLLTRRHSAKIQNQPEGKIESIKTFDPDYDSIVETKIMIKDIDHQVDSIRQWREHQKALTDEKLKGHEEMNKIIQEQHQKYLKKQEQRDEEEKGKILNKLKEKNQIKIVQEEESLDSEKIFDVLAETNNIREKIKNNQSLFEVNDQHEAFIHSFEQLNSIFKKQGNVSEGNQPAYVNPTSLKDELNEIEKEFEEIEELLK